MTDPALVHARWHRALDDPAHEEPGPIRDHIEHHDAAVAAKTLRDYAASIEPGDHHCFKSWCPHCALRKDAERRRDAILKRADRIEGQS